MIVLTTFKHRVKGGRIGKWPGFLECETNNKTPRQARKKTKQPDIELYSATNAPIFSAHYLEIGR